MNNKHRIEIVFKNEEILEDGLSQEFKTALSKKYTYGYNENTTIKELLFYLNENIFPENLNDIQSIIEHYRFYINGEYIEPNINYNLDKFLSNFNLKNKPIKMHYIIGVGGGNGAYIKELAHIRINTREPEHKNHPHVHIYKTDAKKSVSIDLNELKEHKQNKYRLSDFFNKTEIEKIYFILEKYRQDLIDFYMNVQKGIQPKTFIIDYDNEEYIFK